MRGTFYCIVPAETASLPPPIPVAAPLPLPVAASQPASARWFVRALLFPIKFLIGMVFCQSPLGSVLVIGWANRATQRGALRHWWKRSPLANELTFEGFASSDRRWMESLHWPGWFLKQNFHLSLQEAKTRGDQRGLAFWFKGLTQSLWANGKQGLQSILNTWVLTLPAGVLWLFAWYDGWNNSFNKGYEHAAVGPLTGILGIVIFIAVMFYLPLAQARQAVTGNWRSFYDFKLVRKLVRQNVLSCLGLAALYSLFSIPVMVAYAVPSSFPQINQALNEATPERVVKILNAYYFWWALYLFPAFVLLRLLAGRVYAAGLYKAVQNGTVDEEELSESEWEAFHRLDLLQYRASGPRPLLIRLAAGAGYRALRLTCGFLAALLWFSFVAQIFVQAFFNYRGALLWLNQPLVQLPWLRQIPAPIKNPLPEIFIAALVFLLAGVSVMIVQKIQCCRSRSGSP